MDITILSPFGPLDIAPLAIQLFTRQIDRNSKIKTFKGKDVTIIRQKPGVMHLDGEPSWRIAGSKSLFFRNH